MSHLPLATAPCLPPSCPCSLGSHCCSPSEEFHEDFLRLLFGCTWQNPTSNWHKQRRGRFASSNPKESGLQPGAGVDDCQGSECSPSLCFPLSAPQAPLSSECSPGSAFLRVLLQAPLFSQCFPRLRFPPSATPGSPFLGVLPQALLSSECSPRPCFPLNAPPGSTFL